MADDMLPLFVLEDLDDIYVGVPREGVTGDTASQTISASEMTDRQFREWIVGKAAYHGVQILPTMGKISPDTRLALVNRLLKQGVRIYKAPKGTPRWTT